MLPLVRDTVPFEQVLRAVDPLAEAGYDRILIGNLARSYWPLNTTTPLPAWDLHDWGSQDASAADLQDTCGDIDGLLVRRAHLPRDARAASWGEVTDPEQASEDGRSYPVQSAVIAAMTRSDGGQTLLVQCVVQESPGDLGLGSAQHLVDVSPDGATTARWRGLGSQVCCGRGWWTAPTLASLDGLPGAIRLAGAWEDTGDSGGVEAAKATLIVLPAAAAAPEGAERCANEGLVRLAAADHVLVVEDGVAANPRQWRLRTAWQARRGRITLTERWTPVNQPGSVGVYDRERPPGPRGPRVTTRREIRWDPETGRLVEPCPAEPRPDVWEKDWAVASSRE